MKLASADGLTGFGDCAPLPEMGTETSALAEQQLCRGLEACTGSMPQRALAELDRQHTTPAARCGLETALLDLLSQQAGLPLACWLNERASQTISVNAALGALDDHVDTRAWDALAQGYTVLKAKMGVYSREQEQERVVALAHILPAEAALRLDANGRWDEPQARSVLMSLGDLPIESLEEPLAVPRRDALKRLQALVPWPLALDESLRVWRTDDLCADPPVRRLVLKPMVLGGLLPALRLARHGQAAGLEVVVTTTIDSAAGVWAALHLAAALNSDTAHGLGTGAWLQEDVGRGPIVQAGKLALNPVPGLGFRPLPDRPFG